MIGSAPRLKDIKHLQRLLNFHPSTVHSPRCPGSLRHLAENVLHIRSGEGRYNQRFEYTGGFPSPSPGLGWRGCTLLGGGLFGWGGGGRKGPQASGATFTPLFFAAFLFCFQIKFT